MQLRITLHSLCSAVSAALACVACVSPLEIAFDTPGDLSPYSTWSWAGNDAPRVVSADGDATAIAARIDRLVEDRLAERGFRRVRRGGDFIVGYRIGIARRTVVETHARASYQLSSHSWSPSFIVGGSETRNVVYRTLHLAIAASRPQGARLWRAELRQSVEEGFGLTPREAVALLLEGLPPRGPAACDAARGTRDLRPGGAGLPRCTLPAPPRRSADTRVALLESPDGAAGAARALGPAASATRQPSWRTRRTSSRRPCSLSCALRW